ncbi:ribonuclease H [Tanacetum coccineum]
MACVSSVSYSFNINGQVAGHVTLTRGLRQEDPVSPYLFIKCAEVLSSMIRKSVTQRRIHRIRVYRRAPEISHLFFVDDSIFFMRVSNEEIYHLKSMFERYCRSSGQVINYEKYEISFSANVEPHVRTRISDLLSVREADVQLKYLGLPYVIGRSKKVVFQAIIDKIKKKLGRWKEKTLSIGGKEVLIKAVTQAMPMYVMHFFLLPDNLIDDIHKTLNCFWWGDGIKENPIRWSLLAKQEWRMITVPTTLVAKLLKARYFPRSTYFDANVGYCLSYIWCSLISVKEIVRKGCKWNIGDGRHVNVWEDYWLEDHRCLGPKPFSCEVTYVRGLLNNDGDDWDRELLMSLFPRSISNKITTFFIRRSRPDTLYWHNGPRGQFSCKSAYYIALETSEDIMKNLPKETNTLLRAIWKAKVPIKVKLFLWRVWKNYAPNIDNLQARGLNLASVSCTHCRHIGEDVIHVFFKCPVDYHKANEHGLSTSNEALHRWAKPQGDYIKINCDASWIKESGKARLGFVTRNEYGDMLVSGSRVECFTSSPLEAEAKAILWETNHANNKGYLKLCSWSFVRREGNKVAHSIATWALGCSGEIILESRVPECSCKFVTEDVLSSSI